MYSLSEFKKYFEKLSRQHLDIRHTDSTKRFFGLPNRDVLTKLEKVEGIICVLETPEFQYFDNQADNFMKDKTAAFSILKMVTVDDFEAQDNAVDLCERIAHDFVTVMKRDNRDYDEQKFGYLNLNTFSAFKVGPVFGSFYGVRTEFKFGDSISMCVVENHWNFNTGN